jgi:hypothetical protein
MKVQVLPYGVGVYGKEFGTWSLRTIAEEVGLRIQQECRNGNLLMAVAVPNADGYQTATIVNVNEVR